MSRDLSRKEDELESSHREKEQLLEQLRLAEHVRFDFEGNQENYRRQLAGMDGQMSIMKSRLEEADAEAVNLRRTMQVGLYYYDVCMTLFGTDNSLNGHRTR